MPGESLNFPIIAEDRASSKFRDVGRAALDASVKMDVAAASLKLWNDTSVKSGKATDNLIKSKLASTKAFNDLAKAESFVSGEAGKLSRLTSGQSRAFDDITKKTGAAASGFAGLAGTGGLAGGGMTAAIVAGVALSPVIAAAGVGLGGLALAALGAGKSSKLLAADIAPLKSQFAAFQKQLQPVLLADFARGAQLAGTLLHAIEPVSAVAGKALAGVFSQLNTEFRSAEFKGFFTFLAQNAGGDIKLLGDTIVQLTGDLPPLLEALNPLARGLLLVADTAAKASHAIFAAPTGIGLLYQAARQGPKVQSVFQTLTGVFGDAARAATGAGKSAQVMGGHIFGAGAAAKVAAPPIQSMATAVNNLNSAESKALSNLVAYSGDLLTAKTDALALEKALDKSRGAVGLHTAAQRASFSAANTYITDLSNTAQAAVASGKGVDGAMAAIRRGLPLLDSAKTKNRLYWQEVQTLVGWLHRLEAEKASNFVAHVTGQGTWNIQGLPGSLSAHIHGAGHAAGWRVPGTGNSDTVPAMLTPGEAVVPRHLVGAVAPILRAGKVPGFAAGGIAGSYKGNAGGLGPWAGSNWNATVTDIAASIAASMAHSFSGALHAAARSFGAAGPGGGTPGANAALARRMFPQWSTGPLWAAWNYVAMRESGWNNLANNPSSGAFGIAQALPYTKYPKAGWPTWAGGSANPAAQISWMAGYMSSRYGGPAGAAQHEAAFNWYDRGGVLNPGLTLAYNGTGRPELVIPGRGGGAQPIVLEIAPGGEGALTAALLQVLRKQIRVRGGGDVQKALGH